MAQSFAHQLYVSKEWVALRFRLIIERGPICQRCGKVMIDTSQLIGHHIKALTPANINDVMITLNPDNIELVCLRCHNKIDRHFASNSHTVYVVYGAPCSGKMAMVNQLMQRGDMIMDIDRLFECISGLPLYDKPDNLRFNVFALRDKLIDMIRTRHGKWQDAYVVTTAANKQERERLVQELGAELIYCDATRAECIATMYARQLPNDFIKYIDRWFDEYLP